MKKITLLFISTLISLVGLQAQDVHSEKTQSALGFLTIPLDSRSAGIGDVGIGTPTDAYSHDHNPSKYLFGEQKAGVSLSYSPWLRNLVKDMNLANVSGYYVIDSLQSVSASFRYFAMGQMDFTSEEGEYTGNRNPFQLSIDAAYSRKLSQYFGASIGFRYAMANLYPSTGGYKTGNGFAADLAVYFQKEVMLGSLPSKVTAGASLNNIGTKVSFSKNDGPSYFMPMNFRLGAGLTSELDKNNSLMLAGEISRSMVPTKTDKLDDSSISGLFSSIGEGNMRSIAWGLGAEYGFRKMLFGRMGYHHESEAFGNRKYLTFGAGVVYKVAHLDFSYLVTTGKNNDALGNTIRISVAVDIAKETRKAFL